MQASVKYSITASYNGKRDNFFGEFPFTPPTTSGPVNHLAFELTQLAERADRKLATPDELKRILELSVLVAGQETSGSEADFDMVIDAVMSALADKGVQEEDPGEEGWYINRDDLSVRLVNGVYMVEGSASWGR